MTVAFFVVCLVAMVSAENLLDLAKQIGANSLVKLVNDAGLGSILASGGPYTLLAPSDDAIALLPRPVLERLMSDKDFVADMLRYHMFSGKVYTSQLTDEMTVPSLYMYGGKAVLIRFNLFRDGLIKTANGQYLTTYLSNQNASNGIIHIIEKVMYPYPLRSIPAQIEFEKRLFSTLSSALQKTNLAPTLAGGPFTLFAPTNAAFSKLPWDTLNKLMANFTALTDVLSYHVLQGSMWKAGLILLNMETVKTIEGHNLTVSYNYITDRVTMNNARVVEPDMALTSGVIHVIDTVLFPPSFDLSSI